MLRAVLLLSIAACHAAASPPPTNATATAAPCQPIGTWRVTWAPDDDQAYLHALGREFELRVDDAAVEVDDWRVLVGTSVDDAHAEVDRTRCTARVTLRSEFAFADDAGDRTEHLVLEVDLHDDDAAARGTLHLVEVGSDPEDRHVDARGRAARVVEE